MQVASSVTVYKSKGHSSRIWLSDRLRAVPTRERLCVQMLKKRKPSRAGNAAFARGARGIDGVLLSTVLMQLDG